MRPAPLKRKKEDIHKGPMTAIQASDWIPTTHGLSTKQMTLPDNIASGSKVLLEDLPASKHAHDNHPGMLPFILCDNSNCL